MKNEYRNVKIIAVTVEHQDGFEIYIDFSGQRELLCHHRHNPAMFHLLKNGITLRMLRKESPHKLNMRYGLAKYGNSAMRNEKHLTYLCKVVRTFLTDREELSA